RGRHLSGIDSPQPSLHRQLMLAGACVLLALGLVMTLGAWWLFGHFQARVTEDAVQDSVERLLAAIQRGSNGPFLDASRLDPVYQRPLSGHYFLIRHGETVWR